MDDGTFRAAVDRRVRGGCRRTERGERRSFRAAVRVVSSYGHVEIHGTIVVGVEIRRRRVVFRPVQELELPQLKHLGLRLVVAVPGQRHFVVERRAVVFVVLVRRAVLERIRAHLARRRPAGFVGDRVQHRPVASVVRSQECPCLRGTSRAVVSAVCVASVPDAEHVHRSRLVELVDDVHMVLAPGEPAPGGIDIVAVERVLRLEVDVPVRRLVRHFSGNRRREVALVVEHVDLDESRDAVVSARSAHDRAADGFLHLVFGDRDANRLRLVPVRLRKDELRNGQSDNRIGRAHIERHVRCGSGRKAERDIGRATLWNVGRRASRKHLHRIALRKPYAVDVAGELRRRRKIRPAVRRVLCPTHSKVEASVEVADRRGWA